MIKSEEHQKNGGERKQSLAPVDNMVSLKFWKEKGNVSAKKIFLRKYRGALVKFYEFKAKFIDSRVLKTLHRIHSKKTMSNQIKIKLLNYRLKYVQMERDKAVRHK
jgi:hypothetical protein